MELARSKRLTWLCIFISIPCSQGAHKVLWCTPLFHPGARSMTLHLTINFSPTQL